MTDLASIEIEVSASISDLGDVNKLADTIKRVQGPLRSGAETAGTMADNLMKAAEAINKVVAYNNRMNDLAEAAQRAGINIRDSVSPAVIKRLGDVNSVLRKSEADFVSVSKAAKEFLFDLRQRGSLDAFKESLSSNSAFIGAMTNRMNTLKDTISGYRTTLMRLDSTQKVIKFEEMNKSFDGLLDSMSKIKKQSESSFAVFKAFEGLGLAGDGQLISSSDLKNAEARFERLGNVLRNAQTDVANFRKEIAMTMDNSVVKLSQTDNRVILPFDIENAYRGEGKGAINNKLLQIYIQRAVGDTVQSEMSIFFKRNVGELEGFKGGLKKMMPDEIRAQIEEAKRDWISKNPRKAMTEEREALIALRNTPEALREFTKAVLEGGPNTFSEPEGLKKFISMIKETIDIAGSATLVGHNIGDFDIRRIQEAIGANAGRSGLSKADIDLLNNVNVIDTLKLARFLTVHDTRGDRSIPNSLGDVAERYKVDYDPSRAHEAAYDTSVNAKVFHHLMDEVVKRIMRERQVPEAEARMMSNAARNTEELIAAMTAPVASIKNSEAANKRMSDTLYKNEITNFTREAAAWSKQAGEVNLLAAEYRDRFERQALTKEFIEGARKSIDNYIQGEEYQAKVMEKLADNIIKANETMSKLKSDGNLSKEMELALNRAVKESQIAQATFKSAMDFSKKLNSAEARDRETKATSVEENLNSLIPKSTISEINELRKGLIQRLTMSTGNRVTETSGEGVFGKIATYARQSAENIKNELAITGNVSDATRSQIAELRQFITTAFGPMQEALSRNMTTISVKGKAAEEDLIKSAANMQTAMKQIRSAISQTDRIMGGGGSGGGRGIGGGGGGTGGGGGGLPPTPPGADGSGGGLTPPTLEELTRKFYESRDAIRAVNRAISDGAPVDTHLTALRQFRSEYESAISAFRNGWQAYRDAFDEATDPSLLGRVQQAFLSSMRPLDQAEQQLDRVSKTIRDVDRTTAAPASNRSAFDVVGREQFTQIVSDAKQGSMGLQAAVNSVRIELQNSKRDINSYSLAISQMEESIKGASQNLERYRTEIKALNEAAQSSGGRMDDKYVSDVNKLNQGIIQQQQIIIKATDQLDKYRAEFEKLSASKKRTVIDILEQSSAIGRMSNALENLQNVLYTTGFVTIVTALTQTAIAMDRMEATMRATFPTAKATADEMKYLMDTANRLGVSFSDVLQPYARLASASKAMGQSQKELRDLFESTVIASQALGLDSDNTKGIIRAFEQMLSKGKVMAEELRQQLGDRLPGAASIFARAFFIARGEMDDFGRVSQAQMRQFEEAMKDGTVYASQVLPIVARLMRQDMSEAAALMSEKILAEFNRLKNTFSVFSRDLFNLGLEKGFKNIIDSIENVLQDGPIRNAINSIVTGFASLSEVIKNNIELIERVVATIATLLAISLGAAALAGLARMLQGVGIAAAALAATIAGIGDYFLGWTRQATTAEQALTKLRATVDEFGTVSINRQGVGPITLIEQQLARLETRRNSLNNQIASEERRISYLSPGGGGESQNNLLLEFDRRGISAMRDELSNINREIATVADNMNNMTEFYSQISDPAREWTLQTEGVATAFAVLGGVIAGGLLVKLVADLYLVARAATAVGAGLTAAGVALRAFPLLAFLTAAGVGIAGLAVLFRDRVTDIERRINEVNEKSADLDGQLRRTFSQPFDNTAYTNLINSLTRGIEQFRQQTEAAIKDFDRLRRTSTQVPGGLFRGNQETGVTMQTALTRALSGTNVEVDNLIQAMTNQELAIRTIQDASRQNQLRNQMRDLAQIDELGNQPTRSLDRMASASGMNTAELGRFREFSEIMRQLQQSNPQAARAVYEILRNSANVAQDMVNANVLIRQSNEAAIKAQNDLNEARRRARLNNLAQQYEGDIGRAGELGLISQSEESGLMGNTRRIRALEEPAQGVRSRMVEISRDVGRANEAIRADFAKTLEEVGKDLERLERQGLGEVQRRMLEITESRDRVDRDLSMADRGIQLQGRVIERAEARLQEALGSGYETDFANAQDALTTALNHQNGQLDRRRQLQLLSIQLLMEERRVMSDFNNEVQVKFNRQMQVANERYRDAQAIGEGPEAQARINMQQAIDRAGDQAFREFSDMAGRLTAGSAEHMATMEKAIVARRAAIDSETALQQARVRQPYTDAIREADTKIDEQTRLAAALRIGTRAYDELNARLEATRVVNRALIEDDNERSAAIDSLTRKLLQQAEAQRAVESQREIANIRERTEILRTPEGLDRDVAEYRSRFKIRNGDDPRISEYRGALVDQRTQELSNSNAALETNIQLERARAEAATQGYEASRRVADLEKLITEARKLGGDAAARMVLEQNGVNRSLVDSGLMSEKAYTELNRLQGLLNGFSGAKFATEISTTISASLDRLVTAGLSGARAMAALVEAGRRPGTQSDVDALNRSAQSEEALARYQATLRSGNARRIREQEALTRPALERANIAEFTSTSSVDGGAVVDRVGLNRRVDQILQNARTAREISELGDRGSRGGENAFNNMLARLRQTVTAWTDSTKAAEDYYDSVRVGGQELSESQQSQIVALELMSNAIKNMERRDTSLDSAMRSAGLVGVDEDLRAISTLITELGRYEQGIYRLEEALRSLRASGQGSSEEASAIQTQIGVRRERLQSARSLFEQSVADPNNPRNRRATELRDRAETAGMDNRSTVLRAFGFDSEATRVSALADINKRRREVDRDQFNRNSESYRSIDNEERLIEERQRQNAVRNARLSELTGEGRTETPEFARLTAEVSTANGEIDRHRESITMTRSQIDEMSDSYEQLRRSMDFSEAFTNLSTEIGLAGEAMSGFARITSRHFAELLTTGKGSFKEMARSFITDFLAKVIEEIIMKRILLMGFKLLLGSMGLTFGDGGVFSGGSVSGGVPVAGVSDGMFAMGGVFNSGRVTPYANGGLVNQPTLFPMRTGYGLMGEAGPEAIMPLRRLPNGRLGVEAMSDTFGGFPMESPIASQLTTSSLMVNAGTVVLDGRSMLQDWMGNTPQEIASSNRGMPSAMMESQGGPNITVNVSVNVAGSSGTPEQNADLGNQIAKAVSDQFRAMYADETRRQMRSGGMFNQ